MAEILVHFFVEDESECTSERARGQFSIFGAVEEKGGHGFLRIGRDKNLLEDMALSRVEGAGSVDENAGVKKFGKRGVGMCTAGAQEMQKGSGR